MYRHVYGQVRAAGLVPVRLDFGVALGVEDHAMCACMRVCARACVCAHADMCVSLSVDMRAICVQIFMDMCGHVWTC